MQFMFALSLKGTCGADVLSTLHNLVGVFTFVVAAEFVRLAELPLLEDLVFVGNPLQEKHASDWIEEATKRVPTLKKLDGELGAWGSWCELTAYYKDNPRKWIITSEIHLCAHVINIFLSSLWSYLAVVIHILATGFSESIWWLFKC